MVKGDVARARQLLLEDLENLKSIKGWRLEVVFDGAGKSRVGPLGDGRQTRVTAAEKATSKQMSKHGVRTVFTGRGIEADSYIEARCYEAKNVTGGSLTGSFIVATVSWRVPSYSLFPGVALIRFSLSKDDTMIRLAGQNAGALCMGADRFVNELKATKKVVAFRVEAAMAKVNGWTMRPEKLWGSQVFSNNAPRYQEAQNSTKTSSQPSLIEGMDKVHETEDGRKIYTGRFGRGSLIIEDKRKKKPKKTDDS
jgi:acyl-CoA reductase-like NAD-dependent aldehyde dehydrogenase